MRLLLVATVVVTLFFSCSPNNVKEDSSLKPFFDNAGVDGCFALMDNGTGKFTVHNLPRYRDSTFLPASTFKIISSLIGLQTGVISSDSMVIKWNGVKITNTDCNQDLTMYQAFRFSCLNYYQEVARRIGKDTMQYWLDSLHYGSTKIKTKIDSFWIDNSLKISPDEELGLVKRLYFNQLPFFKIHQETVKRAMLFESNSNYRLCYKTGWGVLPHGKQDRNIGWITGWIEENRHPYFFVLNIEKLAPDMDMRKVRMDILKGILKQLGFFEGKM